MCVQIKEARVWSKIEGFYLTLIKALIGYGWEARKTLSYSQAKGLSLIWRLLHLLPMVPYAWQGIGQTQLIALSKNKNISVLGLIKRKGDFRYQLQEYVPKTLDIIEFFDQFKPKRKTVIIIDQAYTSELFKEQLNRWKEQNLFFQFLPMASPALNYIEMLWRKIQYQWMPKETYSLFNSVKMHLTTILDHVDSE